MRSTAATRAFAFLACIALAGCTGLPPPAPKTATQLPRAVRPLHYDVSLVPDAQALGFEGRVGIALEVLEPAHSITLHAAGLDIHAAVLSHAGGSGPAGGAPEITLDAAAQTATFTFPGTIPRGRYRLAIEYEGRIATQAYGLFAIDYDTDAGTKRALFTQLENAAARMVLPCWDEPAWKATFTLDVTIAEGLLAVSNMPVSAVEPLGDGRSRVRFARTPRMSTYLLFFAAGELGRRTAAVGATELGVVTRRGAGEQAEFILESSRDILREYEDYFGIPYPLPKLDNVAAPGSSQQFGAMENWGAILTFEYAILLDPAISTQADRQFAFQMAAHEIAHQWFGNLVTMRWWDDLWLNEGFASWLETRTTARLHPEWNALLSGVRTRDRAMELDALATARPVVRRIRTVEETHQAFDSITYDKGESVLRMLEGFVGAEAWQAGVRRYLAAHAYGNTVSADLWRAMEAVTDAPVAAIAQDFTLQPGVPLIRVEEAACEGGHTRARLSQGEFSLDRPGKRPRRWQVPVVAATVGSDASARSLVRTAATLEVPGCGPLIVNAGQAGYYRTLYARAPFDAIASEIGSVPSIDQLGLLVDTWALALAGLQPPADFLELATRLPQDADPQVWSRVAALFLTLDEYSRADAGRGARVREFARERLVPVFAALGWEPRPGEDAQATILRNRLIEALGALDDPAVVRVSQRLHANSRIEPVPGWLRRSVLAVVARHADGPTWNALRASAQAETSPLVRDELYVLLAGTEDTALARRALELALSDEPGATIGADMMRTVAQLHPDLAWDFALAHHDEVMARLDGASRSRFLPDLAARSTDPAMVAKIRAYAASRLPADARGDAEVAAANVAWRARVREERLPGFDTWLLSRTERR